MFVRMDVYLYIYMYMYMYSCVYILILCMCVRAYKKNYIGIIFHKVTSKWMIDT